jgi:hypothetical protein
MESYKIILQTSSDKIAQTCINLLESNGILAVTTYNSDLLRTRVLDIKIMVSERNFQTAKQLVQPWQTSVEHKIPA